MSSISITGAQLNSEVGPDGDIDSPITIHCAVHCEFAMFTDDAPGFESTIKYASNTYTSYEDIDGRDIVIPSLRSVRPCGGRAQVDIREDGGKIFSILYNTGLFATSNNCRPGTALGNGSYGYNPTPVPELGSLILCLLPMIALMMLKRLKFLHRSM